MDEVQDYYALLGVSSDATEKELKGAFSKKRREYVDDEEISIQLNQAYEILFDPVKKKQYDLDRQFKNQVDDIKEKIRNSTTREEKSHYLIEAQKIYRDILRADTGNVDALWNLVGIEELLGNEEKALDYLRELEQYAVGDDKLQIYHRRGKIYLKQEKTEEAVECFNAVYMADATYAEDIKALARLFYEEKENVKEAIRILNDCISRCSDSKLKIIYLYETLRAVRTQTNSTYQKLEESLYKKLESFHTNDDKQNLVNAQAMLSCLEDAVHRGDFICFRRLEKIYLGYGINDAEMNESIAACRQFIALAEKGKVHKAIYLYLGDAWTEKIMEQFSILIDNEAEQIKESLECVKKSAPKYWNYEIAFRSLEEIVNDGLQTLKDTPTAPKNDTGSHFFTKKKNSDEVIDGNAQIADGEKQFFAETGDEGKHKPRKEIIFACILAAVILIGAGIYYAWYPARQTAQYNQISEDDEMRYQWILTGDELELKYGLDKKYTEETGIDIQLIQNESAYEDSDEYPLHNYVWFTVYYSLEDYGSNTTYVLESNYLSEDEKDALYEDLSDIYNKEYTAYEKCVQFYDLAYSYVQEHKANYGGLLSSEELKERDELDKQFANKTDVDIHMEQAASDDRVDYPDKDYVWLVLWDYGDRTSYELKSNYLSDDEKDALYHEISDVYDDDGTAYEKCRNYYNLAYSAVQEHDAKPVAIMNLVGMTVEQAKNELGKYGILLEAENQTYSSEYAANTIMSQRPAEGTEITKGQTVYVDVSLGEEPYPHQGDNDFMVSGRAVSLEDIYDMFSNHYTLEQVEERLSEGIETRDNLRVQYDGNFGDYQGSFYYRVTTPIYGLEGEYPAFIWVNHDFSGTSCSNEYILSRLDNLVFIDSGYHDADEVTLYCWEDKLIVSVVQGGSATTGIYLIPYGDYPIKYW